DERNQTRPALVEGQPREISSLRVEHVEHDIDRARSWIGAATLQQLEPRYAVAVEHDELAIEREIAVRQRPNRVGDVGEAAGEVLTRSRPERDAVGLALRDGADAVVLLLEDPVRSRDDLF